MLRSSENVDEIVHGKVVDLDLHGKLTRDDFEKLGPSIDDLIRQHGKISMLVTLHDFDGVDLGGFWEDLKWEAKHFNDIARLAIVGEERWHRWMAGFCNAFTTAQVRYFKFAGLAEAYAWLNFEESNSANPLDTLAKLRQQLNA